MSRISVVAIVAAFVLGSMALATDASARHGGGGGGGGGHFGGGARFGGGGAFVGGPRFGGARFVGGSRFVGGPRFAGGRFHHRHFRRGFGFGLGFYPYYADYGYYGCYRWRHVPTRVGWRWVRINVCGYPYALY